MRRALVPLALALVPALPLADTLLVGPPGSGAPFDSIPEAVAAAQPGDTVCVLPGAYTGTETIDIDQPLTLLGAGSEQTTYQSLPIFPGSPTLPLYVHDLGPGEEVRVAGLLLKAQVLGGIVGPAALVVADCAGPVVLADLHGVGATSSGPGNGVAQVRNSSQVLLDACTVTGDATNETFDAQPSLLVESSTVHLNACTIQGSDGPAPFFPPGGDGAPGVLAVDSTLRISRCGIEGGDGKSGFFTLGPPHDGAPGILAAGSALFLRGGPDNSLVGGAGCEGEVGGLPAFGLGAPAVSLDAASFLSSTPDALLAPGPDGDGAVTAPAVLAGGTWTALLERLATLATAPSVVQPGSTVTVGAAGEPGGAFLSFFSFGQGPALAVPGVPGVIVLDLLAYAPLPPLALDAHGLAALPVGVPPVSALAGTTLLVQGLSQSPAGTLSISSPAFVGIAP